MIFRSGSPVTTTDTSLLPRHHVRSKSYPSLTSTTTAGINEDCQTQNQSQLLCSNSEKLNLNLPELQSYKNATSLREKEERRFRRQLGFAVLRELIGFLFSAWFLFMGIVYMLSFVGCKTGLLSCGGLENGQRSVEIQQGQGLECVACGERELKQLSILGEEYIRSKQVHVEQMAVETETLVNKFGELAGTLATYTSSNQDLNGIISPTVKPFDESAPSSTQRLQSLLERLHDVERSILSKGPDILKDEDVSSEQRLLKDISTQSSEVSEVLRKMGEQLSDMETEDQRMRQQLRRFCCMSE